MTPLERLAADVRQRPRGGKAPAWAVEAAAAAKRPLDPARLRALEEAWEYCDALRDIPPALHLALGDWADALMRTAR